MQKNGSINTVSIANVGIGLRITGKYSLKIPKARTNAVIVINGFPESICR